MVIITAIKVYCLNHNLINIKSDTKYRVRVPPRRHDGASLSN